MLPALCKTFSPSRLRTRIYNISFARRPLPGVSAPLWGRGRAVVTPCPAPACAGWGRARAKADAPSHSAPHFPCLRPRPCPPTAESQCAKAECTRQSPLLPVRSLRESPPKTAPLPVRTPRDSLSTAVPLPACVPNHCAQRRSAQGNPRSCPCVLPASARLRPRPCPLVCRITVRKGGSAQGNPRHCPCVLPASACLRPSPCLPTAESLCAKAEVHKATPAPARALSPRQLVYGRAPAH